MPLGGLAGKAHNATRKTANMMPMLAVMIQAQADAAKELALANVEAHKQGWVSQTARQVAASKALAEISALIPAGMDK